MSEQLASKNGPVEVPLFPSSETRTQSVDNTSTGAVPFPNEPETLYHPGWDPSAATAAAEPQKDSEPVETKVVSAPKKPARKPTKTAETK